MASILKRIGGKHYSANFIVEEILKYKDKFKIFVDVFGGAGHITFKLLRSLSDEEKKSKICVINDKDSNITNFFVVLQNREDELREKLSNTIYSKDYFNHCKNTILNKEYKDELEWAYCYFVVNRQCQRATDRYWQICKNPNRMVKDTYFNTIKLIKDYSKLIKQCSIENRDFSKIIDLYDSDDTLFYCDPPYYGFEQWYSVHFSEKDHNILADKLNSITGLAMLSYYPSELINKYYNNWSYKTKEVNLSCLDTGGSKDKRKELLLSNRSL